VPPQPPIYERDPQPRPDSDFETGTLAHLVPGNAGRMLDLRRTPMRVAGLRPASGWWICEITAFEDRGARWLLPFESVAHCQFERGAARATSEALETFEEQVRRFSAPLVIEPDPDRAQATRAALERRTGDAAAWLAERAPTLRHVARIDHASRRAPIATVAAFETFMAERDLLDMDHALARAWVSNPGAGEAVKGHLVVMAEMGIAPFRGTIVRDPETFAGTWRRARRADHVLWRAAFVRAMLAALRLETLELHRGIGSEAALDPARGATLESWSFHRGVAEGVAGTEGEAAHRVVHTRSIPARRAFMTYLETRAMNAQFLEAEAVLFAEGTVAER